MLYELSHFIKEHFSFIWDMIEWGNSVVFGLQHKKAMKIIPSILSKCSERFTVSEVQLSDVEKLVVFFSEQPEEAYTFFKPHGFDAKSLAKLVKRTSFLMYKVTDGEEIVGYFFLRCFANGNAFKGRMVDYRRRNQGIAKQMGNVINAIVLELGLKLFTTISPENYSSLASTKAVNDIRIVRTLENGYYYIECTPKKKDN
ncbi:MAG: transcriptional regulator [Bacteroidaceae bacterium]|nr:transcriptional regulator [Bacteroidaceae bacterium]